MSALPTAPERSKSERDSGASGSAAIGYLLNFLDESAKITGYIPPKNPAIRAVLDENGVAGHEVTLPAPKSGFTGPQRDAIESYVKTLTYWRNLLVEMHWGVKEAVITFTRPQEEEKEEGGAPKLTLREKLRGRAYRAVRTIGQAFVDHGFMVREPVDVTLHTETQRFHGCAIMLKYPMSSVEDLAGIGMAYDKWVPLISDAIARAYEVRSETQKDGTITTVFFTPNKKYVSSLFERTTTFRLFVPRRRVRVDPIFFAKSTFRACRALANKYKKDFDITKKPLPAWGVTGHSLVMQYKRGAGGRLVDESYLYNVRLMTEKLMKKYHLQGSIKHNAHTKNLVITFYTATSERWAPSGRFADGVAVVRHAEEHAPNKE